MISKATQRTILRCFHLIVGIPILGYIYGAPAEMQQYVGGVRYIFVPVIMLSGYWMYTGIVFAILGVAVWLGAFQLFGIGTAILSQVTLFIARKIWLVIRARRNDPQKAVGKK